MCSFGKTLFSAVAVCLMAAILAGCGPERVEGVAWPEPRDPTVAPGPTHPVDPPTERPDKTRRDVVTDVGAAIEGRLSDQEKQRIVEQALLHLQRTIISSEEKLVLSDGEQAADAAEDVLTRRLAELGFLVVQTTASLPFEPSEERQDRFRLEHNCNLVFLIRGEAKEVDKFGDFYSFGAELRMKVLNLTTHQVIASRTFSKRGRRALSETEAANDALRAAAEELTNYLTDEVARRWEATSLVRLNLRMGRLRSIAQADDIRIGLQRQPGVYYVSLESWDIESRIAVYEILCRFDVKRHMAAYVEGLRDDGVRVEHFQEAGEVIDARRRHGR